MINDEYIRNYFVIKGKIMKAKINKLSIEDEIYIYLKNRYKDSYSLEESLYRILNKIENKNICPYCGKPIKLLSFKYGFGKTCNSKECIKKYKKDNSSFKKYETQLKVQQKIKEKYGVSNAYQIKEIAKKAKKNAHSSYANNKRINTCLEKYGVDNVSKSDVIKNKISNVLLNKTKEEKEKIYLKHKETFNKNFGVDWYSKLPSHKKRMSYIISTTECLNKRKETSINRYGIENYNNQQKRNETMKLNNSFNKSKPEDESYVLIKEKYVDVIRQYRSKEYLFNCDFYIPSLDTYIECNYFWTHGFRPYTGSNEDMIRVNEWKENNTEFYNNAIYTWTDLDVRKRNIAKENKLNWFEFFNIDELKEWLNDN